MSRRFLAPALGALLVVGACTGGTGSSPSQSGTSMPPAATPSPSMSAEPSMSASPAAEAPTTVSTAADLKVALSRLLGEHALLAATATQRGLEGGADFEAAAEALEANTVDLGDAIGSIYGDEAKATFLELWRAHIGFFVDYTVATAGGDDAAKTKAGEDLAGYARDFGAFLAGATDLPADVLEAELGMHIEHLAMAVDDYAAEDYAGAYANTRTAYEHMVATAGTLADAIVVKFPDMFEAGSTTPSAVGLRVALNQLLAEHAYLAANATQRGLEGSDAFTPAAEALEANTVDLGDAIGSLYDADAQATFLELWRAHIGFFVDYTTATAGGDDAAKTKAGEDLAGYARDFGAFLAGATDLPADALEAELGMHIMHLAGAVDAYAAEDWATAYAETRTAYAHMGTTADTLAEAIVAKFPEMFGS